MKNTQYNTPHHRPKFGSNITPGLILVCLCAVAGFGSALAGLINLVR